MIIAIVSMLSFMIGSCLLAALVAYKLFIAND